MTRTEQKLFVKNLCSSIALEIRSKIESGIIPENWDGIEFRQLIKDKMECETYLDRNENKKSARYKEYKNTVLINNL